MGYIYMIKNKLDNKCYIGQTIEKDVNTRWRAHKRNMNSDGCRVLYNAFRKYGLDNFDFKIICISFDEFLDALEIDYISKFNSIAPNGYNLESGGNKNKVFHPETCKKISLALTGKKHTEERKLNNSNSQKGKKVSEESKKKMSESRKGKKLNLTDEQRQNRSNRLKGHPTSEKTKQRVAEANKNRVWTEEMKQKISEKSKNNSCKKVGKYSLDGVLLESYNSIKEATEKTNAKSPWYISKCCNNKIKTVKEYIWKFI
jgi:group I intron endonuclease